MSSHRRGHRADHKHPARRSGHAHDERRGGESMPDQAVYVTIVIGGAFLVVVVTLLDIGPTWGMTTVALLALVGLGAIVQAKRLHGGAKVVGWRRSLARLPLRLGGFGVRGRRPLGAAAGDPRAVRSVVLFAVVGVLVLAALAWAIVPEFRP